MSSTLLTIALLCPTGLLDASHDTLTLPEGCPAPFAGQLYTLDAHDGVAQDFAALDAIVKGLRVSRDAARTERDGCIKKMAAIRVPDCAPLVRVEGASWWHVGGSAILGLSIGAIIGAMAL